MARTRRYRNGVLEAEAFPVGEVSDYLQDPAVTMWVDLCSPTEDDLAELSGELGWHQLAVEDAVYEHQRPKLDRYDGHLFLTVYALRFDDDTGEVSKAELAAFITERVLVTVRKGEGFDIDAVVRQWDSQAELAKSGVAFLLHGLLDSVVDGHLDAAQGLDDQIDALEDTVFADNIAHTDLQRRTVILRRSLAAQRRVIMPMREVVNTLMRRDLHVVDAAMIPYFQDVYDHVLRAAEQVESMRELVATLRETQLNIQGNRLNSIMKKVTGWAAVIAVPTAITGYFGQNVPFPGSQHISGLWMSTVAIIAVSVSLYLLFKRKDWL
jgi:magnesium transporter